MRMPLHRTSTVNEIALYHCFWSSSSLWVHFSRGLFTIKEDSTYSTCKLVSLENRCSTNYRFSSLTQKICFQGFAMSSSEVEKYSVTYLACPAVCFQSPISLNIAGVKVQGGSFFAYSSRLMSGHQLQPQAVSPGSTMSAIHIILCFCCLSAICKSLQLNQLTVWLCAISNVCYQILRNYMEHWNPHFY